MSPERFEHLLSLVAPKITKEHTNFRVPISPDQRLVVTLRYLATGQTQQSLSFEYRIGKSTLSYILAETSQAIYDSLKGDFLKSPSSKEEWKNIAQGFENEWDFPHCIGSIDGKHIRVECPKLTGTYYYNYKGFYSIILLAICDSKYCFTCFDLGQYGSNNDCGVLANSIMGAKLENGEFDVPPPSSYKSCSFDPLPYFLVGDEIFPLKTWLMRPFPGQLSHSQKIFNYRLSRCRRTIENAFGVLSARWRIFHTPIRAKIENAEKFTLSCLSLHNYLRLTDNAMYCPGGFTDSYDKTGNMKEGEWRSMAKTCAGLEPINRVRGSRYREDALQMRESLSEFLNSAEGSVSWQDEYVSRTSY